MAVAGREGDQARLALHQRGPVAHQAPEARAHFLALDRFAGHQRHRLGIVGDARDGKTKVGLVALLRELQRDQPPADQVRHRGADARIGERGPDQVAGEREVGAEDRQRRARRKSPQDDGEREQRHDAVEQAGAELVRALQEQQHVVGDAQVDVVDRVVDEAQAVVAAVRHPDRDIALGQPAPPADLQGLAEVILAGGRDDRAERDQAEEEQLALEAVPVARFERVEEARVPLDHRDRDVDQPKLGADHAGEQRAGAPAVLGAEVGEREGEEFAQRDDNAVHDAGPVRTNRIIGMNRTDKSVRCDQMRYSRVAAVRRACARLRASSQRRSRRYTIVAMKLRGRKRGSSGMSLLCAPGTTMPRPRISPR